MAQRSARKKRLSSPSMLSLGKKARYSRSRFRSGLTHIAPIQGLLDTPLGGGADPFLGEPLPPPADALGEKLGITIVIVSFMQSHTHFGWPYNRNKAFLLYSSVIFIIYFLHKINSKMEKITVAKA